jgi:hypothetical protein
LGTVATKDIVEGEEARNTQFNFTTQPANTVPFMFQVLISYGEGYWLSRLAGLPQKKDTQKEKGKIPKQTSKTKEKGKGFGA